MRWISSWHPFDHASPRCGPAIRNVHHFRIFKILRHCCPRICDMSHYLSRLWISHHRPIRCVESRHSIRLTMRRPTVALQSEMSSIFTFSKYHGTVVPTSVTHLTTWDTLGYRIMDLFDALNLVVLSVWPCVASLWTCNQKCPQFSHFQNPATWFSPALRHVARPETPLDITSYTYSMHRISSYHPFDHAVTGCGPAIRNVLYFRIFKIPQHCSPRLCDMSHYLSHLWISRHRPIRCPESRRTIRLTMRRLTVALHSEMSAIFVFSKSCSTVVPASVTCLTTWATFVYRVRDLFNALNLIVPSVWPCVALLWPCNRKRRPFSRFQNCTARKINQSTNPKPGIDTSMPALITE